MTAEQTRRGLVLTGAAVAIGVIAWVDRAVHGGVPLALLYLFPVALASTVLTRVQVAVLAALCTAVAEFADAFPWNYRQGIARDTLYFAAYAAIGLYLSEVIAKRRIEAAHLRAITDEMEARRSAEEQLRLLVASSSIAIITLDESGTVLQANEAAERLFLREAAVLEQGKRLAGAALTELLPSLARVPISRNGLRPLRTMMQCQGMRTDRELFLADVWFATYKTDRGGRMTAMVVDASDEMRNREEAALEQMLNGSRLVVGAVSHEIRNICAAIGLVQSNLLAQMPALEGKADFQTLRQLTGALERMASVELSQVKRQATQLELEPFFRDLQIVVSPTLRESGIGVTWTLPAELPRAWADQQSLLQVFLNLFRNAEIALAETEAPEIRVSAECRGADIEIRVEDNGPGVAHPETLFQPFAARPGAVGFGLYLSRAMMNSFRGELRFQPSERGAVFVIELVAAGMPAGRSTEHALAEAG